MKASMDFDGVETGLSVYFPDNVASPEEIRWVLDVAADLYTSFWMLGVFSIN